MVTYKVSAHVTFASSDMGGLQAAMINPTPSLILLFATLDQEPGASEADQQLGALLDVGQTAVQPGWVGPATLSFWSDLGRIYATAGSRFRLWYAGRVVGDGYVIEELHECA
ncbi:MAG: hypothetical protein ACK5MT_18660 [Actinomycetales bacterium]